MRMVHTTMGVYYFNSRTSCEVRRIFCSQAFQAFSFQLTHLLRGATVSQNPVRHAGHISTHAPLARCDESLFAFLDNSEISTHAPLARCDMLAWVMYRTGRNFNSRTSCEVRLGWLVPENNAENFNSRTSCEVRRTRTIWACTRWKISTHAPLARCDQYVRKQLRTLLHFNSRTSCEVRPIPLTSTGYARNFNSRTSCEVRR